MVHLCVLLALVSTFLTKANASNTDNIAKACQGYLTTRYDWGCGDTPTVACACENAKYLSTARTCIDALVNLYGANEDSSEAVVAYMCGFETTTLIDYPVSEGYEPVSKLDADGFKLPMSVNAFIVSTEDARAAYMSVRGAQASKAYSLVYGKALVIYWIGMILLKAFFYWMSFIGSKSIVILDCAVVRQFRRFVTMPALFRSRHCNTISVAGFTLNIPTRLDSLVILMFVVLNLVLMVVHTGYWNGPNYLYEDDLPRQYSRLIGMRSGYLCMYILPVMFLFAGRNNLAIWLTGWSLDTFNVFHKWLGRIAFANLLIHAAGYTVKMLRSDRYATIWKVVPWDWATVGFVFSGVMVFAALHCFRRMSYEFFLWFHIFCAIFFVVGGYFHLLHLNESLGWYWAILAIWIFDRLARVVRIIISGVRAKAVVKCYGEDILELTVSYSGRWQPYAGAYAFIHILTPGLFWQSHPFSVNNSFAEGEDGKLKFYCRVKKGMTRRLHAMAADAGGSLETSVLIDGPYGAHANLNMFKEFVLISGGIGITACFGQIVTLLSQGHRDISLHWTMSDSEPLRWFRNEIDFMIANGVKLHLYVRGGAPEKLGYSFFPSANFDETPPLAIKDKEKEFNTVVTTRSISSSSSVVSLGPVFINTRMDPYGIVSRSIAECYGPLSVLCCGPGGVSDQCRKGIADHLMSTDYYVQYFEESFSW